MENRNDVGLLWENYLVSERIKAQSYFNIYSNNYFWRTYDQQEIDWLEERGGNLHGYEFKWQNKKVKVPKAFAKAYPDASFHTINNENYFDWLKPSE